MKTVKVLAKVALGFWPPATAAERLKDGPNPKLFVRVPKDVITEVPEWVLKDKEFQWTYKDGNVVVIQDVPVAVVPIEEIIEAPVVDEAPKEVPVKKPRK